MRAHLDEHQVPDIQHVGVFPDDHCLRWDGHDILEMPQEPYIGFGYARAPG